MNYQKDNMARMKQYYKKVKQTNQEKWKVIQNRLNGYNRKQIEKETAEQRQKRLLRYEVYQTKRKAKLKMEEEGVPPEEIEMRLVEVVRQVEEKDRLERERKPVDTAEYKPREAARKPKKKNLHQLETPSEKEEQNDNSSNFSSTLPQQPNASLMEESCLSTRVNDGVIGDGEEESVVCDYPVAAASVQDFSQPFSPAALAFQDDDDECFSGSVQSPNSSFPTTVNLDNLEGMKPNKKNAQQFETPSVSTELTEQPSHREDTCSSTQSSNVVDEEESVIHANPVAARSLIDSYAEPSSPAPPFEDDDNAANEDDDDDYSDFVPSPPSSSPRPTPVANLNNSEASSAPETSPILIVEEGLPASSENKEPSSLVDASENVGTGNKTNPNEDRVGRVICDESGKCMDYNSIRLHKHLLHNPSPQVFKCPKCGNSYATASSLWLHYLEIHEETVAKSSHHEANAKKGGGDVEKPKQPRVYGLNGPFICEECGKQYKEKAYMEDHMRRVHLGQRFICEVCGKEEQAAGKLWRHKVNKHPELNAPPPEGMNICEYCAVPVLRSYPHHVKKIHGEKYEEFMQSYSVVAKKSNYRTGKRECTVCNKIIGIRWMKTHMINIHGGTKQPSGDKEGFMPTTITPETCPHCEKKFKNSLLLKRHIQFVHTFVNFDRKVDAMKLIREEVDKDGQRILFCSLCDEELFIRKHMGAHLISSHLEVYEKVKKGESTNGSSANVDDDDEADDVDAPPWRCGECSEIFRTEQLLYSHVHSCHPATKYYCSYLSCHKLFKGFYFLKSHHRKEHPHAKFRNPLLHEGGTYRRPQMICSQCKMKFVRKPQFLEHVKSLHPENYWLCSHCESLCDTKQLLETHLSECRRNPEVKRKVRIECLKRNRKASRKRRNKGMIESDHDDDVDVDAAPCESLDEIGTRRSSRIKEKKTRKKVKLIKLKAKRDKVHNDHKLNKEVKVILVRLTQEDIEFYKRKRKF